MGKGKGKGGERNQSRRKQPSPTHTQRDPNETMTVINHFLNELRFRGFIASFSSQRTANDSSPPAAAASRSIASSVSSSSTAPQLYPSFRDQLRSIETCDVAEFSFCMGTTLSPLFRSVTGRLDGARVASVSLFLL